MPEQVTIRDLLKDPVYKAWFKKVPDLGVLPTPQKPWRIYARADARGSWAKLDLATYQEAYRWLASNLPEYYDIVINCKRQESKPPVVTYKRTQNPKTKIITKHKRYHVPAAPGDENTFKTHHKHHWCGYCRRPTLFLWYTKHHAMPGRIIVPHDRRCVICGARYVFVKHYEGGS